MRYLTTLAVWVALGAAPDAHPLAAQAAAPREPLWKTVLLAPARVAGHGRFDAAMPSYQEDRAAARAEAAAARAGRCADCPCGPKR